MKFERVRRVGSFGWTAGPGVHACSGEMGINATTGGWQRSELLRWCINDYHWDGVTVQMNLEVIHDDGRNKEETKFMIHMPTPLTGRRYEQKVSRCL